MIEVKNLYYMLAYAYQDLEHVGYRRINSESFDNAQNLLSAILIKAVNSQIKSGLTQDYVDVAEISGFPRGKLDFSATVKLQTSRLHKVAFQYGIYSENNMFNKIIKSTMLLLLHSKRVNHDNKQELRRLIVFFSEVDLIELKNINWRGLHMELNSKSFRTLMNVCYLIINGLLLTTETGGLALAEYVDEQQTYKIFEKFILRYFQVEHPELRANAAYIGWNSDDGYIEFLPQMKSDIVLSFGGKKLIIDAKYYSKNMRKSQFGTKDVMISSNLYQIFTYVKNMDTEQSGKISGMLLYAHVDDNSVPDNDYMLSGNKIYIRSLDVNEDWSVIVRQLEDISKLIKAEQ